MTDLLASMVLCVTSRPNLPLLLQQVQCVVSVISCKVTYLLCPCTTLLHQQRNLHAIDRF